MMRPKSLILLALALGCGLIASIGISQVLDSNKQTAAVETVPIYVALSNINLGDPIDDSMVSLQEWPKSKVPVGAIAKWEDLEDRRPRTVIYEGEPLMDGKLLIKGQRHDPIAGIPPGMRLKTVSVDARKSAAGLLSPGDRVDVQLFVHRNERENIPHPFTKIILQNVRVYAVDQAVQRSADGTEARTVAKTVSLVVSPQQANRITTAENLGEISLIPRHPDDDKIVEDWDMDSSDILSRSGANNRKKEQVSLSGELSGIVQGLPGAIRGEFNRTAKAAPAFRMKIIYPNEVTELRFSEETGEPLPENNQNTNTSSTVSASGSDGSNLNTDSGDDSPNTVEDFPIDLRMER